MTSNCIDINSLFYQGQKLFMVKEEEQDYKQKTGYNSKDPIEATKYILSRRVMKMNKQLLSTFSNTT